MTKLPAPKRSSPTSEALSGVERQRRYRSARDLVSIDVSRPTASLVQALRTRTGLTTDQVIAAAAEALVDSLPKKARTPRLLSSSTRKTRRRLSDDSVANDAPSKGPAGQPVHAPPPIVTG